MTAHNVPAIGQASTRRLFPLGATYTAPDGKVYKYVQYLEGTAAVDGVAGEVAAYNAEDGYKLNQVTSDYSDTDDLGAGVLPVGASDEEFLWIQIKGPATLSIALTGSTDGLAQTVAGAADGTLDDAATLEHRCAYAVDASAKEIIADFPL